MFLKLLKGLSGVELHDGFRAASMFVRLYHLYSLDWKIFQNDFDVFFGDFRGKVGDQAS